MDGLFELDPIDRGGDPSVNAVAASFDESGLVDVAEDHSPKDGPVLVRIPRERDNPEGEASFICGIGVGQDAQQ